MLQRVNVLDINDGHKFYLSRELYKDLEMMRDCEIYSRFWGKIFGRNKDITKSECTRLQWWTQVSTMQGIIQRPGNDKGIVGNIF